MPSFRTLKQGIGALPRGALRATAARLRLFGLLARSSNADQRLAICSQCHLCTVVHGKVFCGKPLLHQVFRDLEREGCGCPIAAKAADPHEHCPIRLGNEDAPCTCKWCKGQ